MRFQYAFFALLSLCLSSICHAQPVVNSYLDNSSGDMLLMYYGGKYRNNWTVDQLKPIVTHKFNDGHTDWFFPSFLYLEFRRNQALFGNDQPGGSTDATKEDWEWIMDRLFCKNQGLDALDKCIEQCKASLGDPPFRHKVVLVIPSPRKNQTNWGRVNNKTLDFRKSKDKVTAVKWYVNEILARFAQQNYTNISLDGLYWVDETSTNCSDILAEVGKYVRQCGTKFYWIPFSTARGRFDWKAFNVDCCYLQTGFFWHTEQSVSRLRSLCASAKKYGMGLEFEINKRIMNDPNTYIPRINTLINVFEQEGVFDNCGITYYFDNKIIQSLNNSTLAGHQQFMDRLAGIICRRNKALASQETVNKEPRLSPSSATTGVQTKPQNKDRLDWRDPEYWHF